MGYKPKDYSRYIGFKQKRGRLTIEAILEPRQCGFTIKQYCKVRCQCGRSAEKQLTNVIHEHVLSCGMCDYKNIVKKEKYNALKIKQTIKCPFIADMCVKSEALRLCCHECNKYSACGNRCLNTPKECGAKRKRA